MFNDFKELSKKHTIEELKSIMKNKYNLQRKKDTKQVKFTAKKSRLEDFTVDRSGCIQYKGQSVKLHYSALNEIVSMKVGNKCSDAHIITWYGNTHPKVLRILLDNVDTPKYWELYRKLEDDFCKLRGFE